ncbi:MAG: hypothetical protein QXT77_08215 [Candidatus Methanomethylicaceae archaeon]
MSDVLTAAGINAAAQTANNMFNIAAVNRMNRKTRKWNEQMYERQKADNIAFWNMQNAYNDPSAQMARLKAAGLNPNLVYGSSSPANTADSISSPNKPQWHPDAPRLDLNATDVLHQMYAIPNLQAQTENLKENNALLRANALKVAAETANLGIKNAQDQLTYDLSKSLFATTVEQAKMNLRKTETDILTAIDANDRANALHAPNLERALTELLRARLGVSLDQKTLQALEQDIQKKISENRILKKQAEMWENNQNPNDPTWLRWAFELIKAAWEKVTGETEEFPEDWPQDLKNLKHLKPIKPIDPTRNLPWKKKKHEY